MKSFGLVRGVHSFRHCLGWNLVTKIWCSKKRCLQCISAVRHLPGSVLTWAQERQAGGLVGQMNKWILLVPLCQYKNSFKFPAGHSATPLMGEIYYPTATCSLTLPGAGRCLPPVFIFPMPATFMGLVFAAGLRWNLLEPGWHTPLILLGVSFRSLNPPSHSLPPFI